MTGTTPPADPQGDPPTGTVAATATCCPLVSTFEGSRLPAKVFGFDARTNIVDPGSNAEYWMPPDKGKIAPDDLMTRDGARWCSVPLGQTTELEISFEGQTGNGCIANCEFEMSAPGIVQIETPTVAGNAVPFRIRGLAEGETSIRVICEGKDLGWIHVICFPMINVNATIGAILTTRTRVPAYDAAGLSRVLNHAFRQACINVTVRDIGTIDLRGNAILAADEGQFFQGDVHGDTMFQSLMWSGSDMPFLRSLGQLGPAANGAIALFFYSPVNDQSQFNGSVVKVGEGPGFCFKGNNIDDCYAILAHELGHIFGLHHPNQAGEGELPAHLVASIGGQIRSEPATNTELAIDGSTPITEGDRTNIMALDPLNMMGYWPKFQEQVYIRKDQWIACRSLAMTYQQRK